MTAPGLAYSFLIAQRFFCLSHNVTLQIFLCLMFPFTASLSPCLKRSYAFRACPKSSIHSRTTTSCQSVSLHSLKNVYHLCLSSSVLKSPFTPNITAALQHCEIFLFQLLKLQNQCVGVCSRWTLTAVCCEELSCNHSSSFHMQQSSVLK